MKILVTGGAGFIGSHLVDRLVQNGQDEIVIFDNLTRGKLENISQHRHNPQVHFIQGDLREFSQVEEAVKGCQLIYHLGGQTNVMRAVQDVDYSFNSNVLGTYHILKAARQQREALLVFSSSREVYGEPRHLPVDESHPTDSKNTYGVSKISAELYCRVYRELYNLQTVILRITNVYGPRDYGRVIPIWIQRARAGLPLQIFGGQQVIDFIPVDLAVEALLRAAQRPHLAEPINIASGKGTPILDLARTILDLTNSPSQLQLEPPRSAEVVRFVARVERMHTQLELPPPEDSLEQLPGLIRIGL